MSATKGTIARLRSGDRIVRSEPSVLSATVDSSVAVCVFSDTKKVGGMALLDQVNTSSREVSALIDDLSRLTHLRSNELKAKIVGRGEQLVTIIKEALAKRGVSVIGADIGGNHKREVFFYTDSGRLRVSQEQAATPVAPITQSTERKKRVLIVDDSKTIRDLLTKVLSQDEGLEVVDAVSNPIEAQKAIPTLRPDVLTLDINMPEMDGVTYLEKLLPMNPLPVVMISSISIEDGNQVIRALELGAVDYIQKPTFSELAEMAPLICDKVRTAANVDLKLLRQLKSEISKSARSNTALDTSKIVAIGSSTGGTQALHEVLTQLPDEIPPIVIVQHIPPVFSTAFANRMDSLCPFTVKEAQDGEQLKAGNVYIAPGGKQMKLRPIGPNFLIKITDDPPVNRHKPSVDYLFDSVAEHVGNRAIGIILTGMGADGAAGLLKIREAGGRTIAQDENGCVVFGMPKAAIKLGAAEKVCTLNRIPDALVQWLSKRRAA